MTYVEKTYPQFLPIFRKNPDSFKSLKVKHKSTFKQTAAADGRAMMTSLAQCLHPRGYRCFYDGRALYAHRGLLARFGSSLTHLGLITIILAALIEVTFKVGTGQGPGDQLTISLDSALIADLSAGLATDSLTTVAGATTALANVTTLYGTNGDRRQARRDEGFGQIHYYKH